ncbi:MAG: poly(A) polymerase [Rhodothermales bacterium]|jgi:poly(A) polymerase
MPIKHKINPNALQVIDQLHKAGYEAYLVGGAVRDLLLGIDPKDYDLATSATPEEVKTVFGRRSRLIGRRFRLAHVYVRRDLFEVSTFRRTPNEKERKIRETDDGLMVWSDNEYGTLEEDAFRRDFTANALYYDPFNTSHEVTDLVGGVADIENCKVRTIGDPRTRMVEDPVRMLRACKLAGQYGFEISDELATVIAEESPSFSLTSVARRLEELFKIFHKACCAPTLEACDKFGLLPHFLPEIAKGWEDPTLRQRGLDMLAARDRLLAKGDIYPSRVTGLAALLVPLFQARKGTEANQLWRNSTGVDAELHGWIREMFAPYNVPRHIIAKTRETMLLLPKMCGPDRRKARRHREFARARDAFRTMSEAVGQIELVSDQ